MTDEQDYAHLRLLDSYGRSLNSNVVPLCTSSASLKASAIDPATMFWMPWTMPFGFSYGLTLSALVALQGTWCIWKA